MESNHDQDEVDHGGKYCFEVEERESEEGKRMLVSWMVRFVDRGVVVELSGVRLHIEESNPHDRKESDDGVVELEHERIEEVDGTETGEN